TKSEIAAELFWQDWLPGGQKNRSDELRKADLRIQALPALLQILPGEAPEFNRGLPGFLQSIDGEVAAKALVKQVLFASESSSRETAVRALSSRTREHYCDELIEGLNHPWPQVAARAASALVELRSPNSLPKLVAMLEAPDPTEPFEKELEGKKT